MRTCRKQGLAVGHAHRYPIEGHTESPLKIQIRFNGYSDGPL
jgi:hypothetical protein